MSIISWTSPRPSLLILPALQRDQQTQIVFVLAQRLADVPDDLARAAAAESPPLLERRRRRFDRRVRNCAWLAPTTRARCSPVAGLMRNAFLTCRLLDPPAAHRRPNSSA